MKNNINIQFVDNDISDEATYFFTYKNIILHDKTLLNWNSSETKKYKYFYFSDENSSWIGACECGYEKDHVYSEVFNNFIAVIVSGQAFWINYKVPSEFFCIQSYPIISMYSSLKRNEVYFVGLTEITCFGENGLIWITDRLSYDGIKNISIFSETIEGIAWDASLGKDVLFNVSVIDGTHTGGAFFG